MPSFAPVLTLLPAPSLLTVLTRLPLIALICVSLAACGGSDEDDDNTDTAPPVVSPVDPTPGAPDPDPTPEPEPASPYVSAKPDDVIKVAISELHPTQIAVGYDQIYYHLGRKQPDLGRYSPGSAGYLGDDDTDNYSRHIYRSERKRGDDYCADNGQGGLNNASYQPHTLRLIDPNTFQCSEPPPESGSAQAAELKTVVVGPHGRLYLTDGHHTLTVLNELADGGASLPVWLRVAANFSDAADTQDFWARMADAGYVWLRDADANLITPQALPEHVALANFQDDEYRSLVYLTRDLGYSNASVSEFAEFNWGSWLRSQGLNLNAYTSGSLDRARVAVADGMVAPRAGDSTTSLVAAVRDAAILMVTAAPQTEIGPGRTGTDLGQLPVPTSASAWNDVMEDDIWRADTNSSGRYRTAGKAWYAVKYRQCGGPAATQPACWMQPVQ